MFEIPEAVPYEQRARSFGAVAEHYERYRPGPPESAVEWVVPQGCQAAVDMCAGTGALTRLLAERVPEVIAVEPDQRMRAVLRQQVAAEVVGAVGEALPFRDGRFDLVTAASAWHWMDPERATAEVVRILRPGGTLGLMWNSADRSVEWVLEMLGPRSSTQGETTPTEAKRSRPRRRTLPEGAPFKKAEEELFKWSSEFTVDDLVGLAGSYSRVITLPDGQASAILERVRRLAVERAGAEGATTVQLPMVCQTFRFVRD
jgi:SAM-dependent methyltransferase